MEINFFYTLKFIYKISKTILHQLIENLLTLIIILYGLGYAFPFNFRFVI